MENQKEIKEGLENNLPNDEEVERKKKIKILIIIEIIFLLLVIILAIIFFSSRNKSEDKISNYYGKSKTDSNSILNNQTINENESSSINMDNPSSVENNSPTSIISGQPKAESQRLYLPVPSQSPVSTEEQIPIGAVKIIGLENGFSPSEFKVKAGEKVTLALTSRIDYPVILTFYEETMPAISIGCSPRETRWITFDAPKNAGRYIFKNDVLGKSDQIGTMIVE